MVDVLITGSLVLTGEESIREGYVYISDGVVKAVGSGLPPEDYTDATLTLGGDGRIIAPGLAVSADVAAYPVRFLKPSMARRLELYRALGDDALFTLSLPAVYELHLHGATTILVEVPNPSLPLRLADAIGGFYGHARPACIEGEEQRHPRLSGAITVGDESCPGGERLMLESPPVYIPRLLQDPWAENLELRKRAGIPGGLLKEGERAEIAVFNAAKPPGMLLDKNPELELSQLFLLGLRVETLIAGEDVLVDAGEHLYIVTAHLDRARSLVARILGGR